MIVRVVFDTNIYASALMNPSGTPGKALRKAIDNPQFQIVVSQEILDETERILFYPKVRKKISGSDEDLRHWLDALVVIAHVADSHFEYEPFGIEDPDDEMFLAAALESEAKYIVSGDAHLLSLKKVESVKILSPREFLG